MLVYAIWVKTTYGGNFGLAAGMNATTGGRMAAAALPIIRNIDIDGIKLFQPYLHGVAIAAYTMLRPSIYARMIMEW